MAGLAAIQREATDFHTDNSMDCSSAFYLGLDNSSGNLEIPSVFQEKKKKKPFLFLKLMIMYLILQFIIDFPFSGGILLFSMTRNVEVQR